MVVGNSRSCQAFIIWSVVTHSLEPIQDERLHVAKGVNSSAKMASVVH